MKEKQKLTNTLEKFVSMYGEEKGLEKYNQKNSSNSKNSKIFAKKVGSKFYDKRSIEFCKKQYGEDWESKFHESNQKAKNTCLLKYGSESFLSSDIGKEKIRKSLVKSGRWSDIKDKDEFEKFKRKVQAVTRSQDLSNLENIEKRANHAFNKEAWHLDHKISIIDGYKNSISTEIIGHIDNLQMLEYKENISKHSKSYSVINRNNSQNKLKIKGDIEC